MSIAFNLGMYAHLTARPELGFQSATI